MTLNEMLGAVVGQLQSQESTLNAADPQHPQHGTELLSKFQAAQAAAPTDPNADLGDAFSQISHAMSAQGNGFTAQSYGDAFAASSQAFAGRPNQLSLNDLAPILGALTKGFGNHDTRGTGVAGPLAALAPLLGMLTGGSSQPGGGGLDLIGLASRLLGGGHQGGGHQGGVGGILGQLMGGSSSNQQGGGLGGMLGGLLGGSSQPPQAQAGLGGLLGGLMGGQQSGGSSDLLGQLMGAVQQGANQTNARGTRDAGAVSTGAVLEGILGAFMKR